MGLFGLFATLFGLGAMAKDGISDMIDDADKYQKASNAGCPWYTVNGYRTRSTQTGRDAYRTTDFNTQHVWLVDKVTDRRIEDLTLYYRRQTTEKNRKEAYSQGKKFYRTAEFDMNGSQSCDIYVNDDMPGKYFYQVSNGYEYGGGFQYQEGELVSKPKTLNPDRKEVKWDYANRVWYYEDGTLVTDENKMERYNAHNKEWAIKYGERFYRCMGDARNNSVGYYRDVETDEPVYYNYREKYYTKGELTETEVRIKPHHAETMTVYDTKEVPGYPRYNLDGSEWLE